MATPRSQLIDDQQPMHYHIVSRCVRRSFLCGKDKRTGKDYSHRKGWIEERLKQLTPYFAVAIDAYAIMSNHLHTVLYYDPLECRRWSDAEVARRWTEAFPPRRTNGDVDEAHQAFIRQTIEENPALALSKRKQLGSVSYFMKYLKQPIAVRANAEDGCKGHFWEQRFYSGALLDEDSLLTAMVYVDLNPVRAKIARDIEDSANTGVYERLRGFANTRKRLKRALRPLWSGLSYEPKYFRITLQAYVDLLKRLATPQRRDRIDPEWSVWSARLASIGGYQRAYGREGALTQWLEARGFRALEAPLPG